MRTVETKRTRRRHRHSDIDLVLEVNRAKRRNRANATKQGGWERELWAAYLPEGPAPRPRAANEPLDDIA